MVDRLRGQRTFYRMGDALMATATTHDFNDLLVERRQQQARRRAGLRRAGWQVVQWHWGRHQGSRPEDVS